MALSVRVDPWQRIKEASWLAPGAIFIAALALGLFQIGAKSLWHDEAISTGFVLRWTAAPARTATHLCPAGRSVPGRCVILDEVRRGQ